MSGFPISADETESGVNRTGIYFAVLQLVFTLGWTTYLIYLPMLAAQVGIAPSAVILILMLDQAIFTITDTAMGIAADRIAPVVGRLGAVVGGLTALSCAAFLAMPFVAGAGPDAVVVRGPKLEAQQEAHVATFTVKKGDKVLISKYGGTEIKVEGDTYLIMREDDILGIIG